MTESPAVPVSVDSVEYGRFVYVESVPYWTLQWAGPLNPHRKVQRIVALLCELTPMILPDSKLLVVPI